MYYIPIVCTEKDERVVPDILLVQLRHHLSNLPVHRGQGVTVVAPSGRPRVPPVGVLRVVRVLEGVVQEEGFLTVDALPDGLASLRGILLVQGHEVYGLFNDGGAIVERTGAEVLLAAVDAGSVWMEADAAWTVTVGCRET